jgi:hypothetical protein
MLAACSQPSPEQAGATAQVAETIPCALAGAKDFAETCTVERAGNNGVVMLVVRHPDGGFRRFELLDDGHRLAVADGAAQAVARLEGDRAEVAVDLDRYRFPIKEGRYAASR